MVFQSSTYSVLLVSASEKMNTAVQSLLPSTDFWPVTTVRSISQARRLLLEKTVDILLVNAPLTDGSGVQLCIDACSNSESAVLLLVRSELYEETYYKLLPYGSIVLPKPTNAELLSHSLRALCSMRERLRSVKKEQATVEEKMQELRLINKAKWVLIQRTNMTEEEAHRYFIHQAMEKRISKRELAESILLSGEAE